MDYGICDMDGDGCITFSDVFLFRPHFGTHEGDVNWNPSADFNGDGVVDIADAHTLQMGLMAEFGKIMAGTSTWTPPPGTYTEPEETEAEAEARAKAEQGVVSDG